MENLNFELKQLVSKPDSHVVEFKIKEEGLVLSTGTYSFSILPTDIVWTLFDKKKQTIDSDMSLNFKWDIVEIKDSHYYLNIKVSISNDTTKKLINMIKSLDNIETINTPSGKRPLFSLNII